MSDYDREKERIRRRRAMAEALMAAQSPQGQMAGRYYVAPSPWQNLATLGSQLAGAFVNRRLDKEEQSAVADESRRLAEAYTASRRRNAGAASDRHASADLATFNSLPLGARQQLLSSQAAASLQPQPPEAFTLSPGQTRYQGDKVIAQAPQAAPAPTDDVREYELAKQEGFRGNFVDWMLEQRRAGATNVNVPVNTEKSFYGTLAGERAKSISDLYDQAVKAPDLVQRAQRVRELVGPDSQALTGMGANWMLGAAKVANQLGINTGDAAADTEVLMTQLAASTLDSIKSSGLGGGTGFSNADRDFLERVVGGKITLEAKTLARLAELNERAALKTVERWNDAAGRLDPQQLRSLGLGPIEMPKGTPPASPQPKLQRNPDGSYTYTP